jgi:hypothetical protein
MGLRCTEDLLIGSLDGLDYEFFLAFTVPFFKFVFYGIDRYFTSDTAAAMAPPSPSVTAKRW